jgi:glutamyl-tRNA reductase
VDFRRRIAFSPEQCRRFIKESVSEFAKQCVVVCTCNRTEIYLDADCRFEKNAAEKLCDYGGVTEEELAPAVLNFVGDKALTHLFRTTAGLDSMVVGEDEILRQLKEAYAFSVENGGANGNFKMIFQAAFACAKRIKTDTGLSKTSVSIATLAANKAADFANAVKSGKQLDVLLIGATGKTGMTVLKNLASHKNISVTAAVRSRGESFDSIKSRDNVKAADYSVRYDFADTADCIISATSAPHYTLTAQRLRTVLTSDKPRLFIDLAVPPDIDPAAARLDGVQLIGIDYFERLAEHNNTVKADSAEIADMIVGEEVCRLKKDLAFRDFQPNMPKLKGMSAEKMLYRLRTELDSESFSAVLDCLSDGFDRENGGGE